MRTIVAALTGVCACVVTVFGGKTSEAQSIESVPETVVYSSLAPGNWDLYLFEEPGSAPRRLTNDPGLDYNPVVSPDGRWVVFTSERTGNPDLYVLDLAEPGIPVPLTQTEAMEDAAVFSPDGGTLVFVGSHTGNPDIYTMPFDPERLAVDAIPTNLTRHAAGDYNPSVSPDGTKILFSSSRVAGDVVSGTAAATSYEASELYVMRADGTDVRRLTQHDGWDGSPSWTPDGRAVVFYSERDGEPRIYRMGLDGSQPRPLSAADVTALSPAVSHDGRVIYTRRRDNRWALVSAGPLGEDPRLESDGARDYWAPAYVPGSHAVVAFGPGPTDAARFASDVPGPFVIHSARPVELPDRTVSLTGVRGYLPALSADAGEVATSEGFARLVVTRLDGTHKRVVFDRVETDFYRGADSPWSPSWSRDGEWLAFSVGMPFGGPNDDVDIWRSRPNGSEATNLTPDSDANDAIPAFSPDGQQVVFRSMRDGNAEIYVMSADGTNPRRLTEDPATDTMPSFSSKGDRVAFVSLRDGDYELYLLAVGADGGPGSLERLTDSPGRDMHPKFSPDDEWVIFTSERGKLNDELPVARIVFQPQPYGEIHAIRLSDRHVVRLTHNKWEDGPAAWR